MTSSATVLLASLSHHISLVELVYGVRLGKLGVHLPMQHCLVHFVVQQHDAAQQLARLKSQAVQ